MVATTIEGALRDWSWLFDPDGIDILDTSCLGDVIFKNQEGQTMVLDLAAGEVREFDTKEQEWYANQGTLITRLEREGLQLGPGKCYGMKPHSIFKSLEAENMYVATLPEYVSFMGYFHKQIEDLPDGTTVTLKVKQ